MKSGRLLGRRRTVRRGASRRGLDVVGGVGPDLSELVGVRRVVEGSSGLKEWDKAPFKPTKLVVCSHCSPSQRCYRAPKSSTTPREPAKECKALRWVHASVLEGLYHFGRVCERPPEKRCPTHSSQERICGPHPHRAPPPRPPGRGGSPHEPPQNISGM